MTIFKHRANGGHAECAEITIYFLVNSVLFPLCLLYSLCGKKKNEVKIVLTNQAIEDLIYWSRKFYIITWDFNTFFFYFPL